MIEYNKFNGLNGDELFISNLEDIETDPEKIEQILKSIEIVENFAFYDEMNLIEN